MEKLAVKILRYLKKQSSPVPLSVLTQKYGCAAERAVTFLDENGFVSQGSEYFPHETDAGTAYFVKDGKFSIASSGCSYLEHKFADDFDRWITRGTAVIGFVTGVISLILHLIGYSAG